jgi:hypothetical protein
VAAVLVRSGRSESEARTVAAAADGSVGRALEVSAGELAEARDAAARALAHAATSPDPRRRIEGARNLMGKTDRSDREQLAAELRAMASLIRDVELLAAGADPRALGNPEALATVERLAAFRGIRGTRAFSAIDRALVALEHNASAKIVADWLVLQL